MAFFYCLMGVAGYLAFQGGTSGNIMNNYSPEDPLIQVLSFFLGTHDNCFVGRAWELEAVGWLIVGAGFCCRDGQSELVPLRAFGGLCTTFEDWRNPC